MAQGNTARKLDVAPVEGEEQKPFEYDLPKRLIAERPCYPFHEARMLNINRKTEDLEHSEFSYLPLILGPDDVLVLNNTQVMKARLFGNIDGTGKAVELLLLEELPNGHWRAMGRPLKKLKAGSWINFSGEVRGQVIERVGDYEIEVAFQNKREELLHCGTMPIPPYIRDGKGDAQDIADYQTAYAKHEGSVAAPTAGLHFTDELLSVLDRRGVSQVEITLHVGPASFLSVWEEGSDGQAKFRPPGTEQGVIDEETFTQLKALKLQGKRIIAVGTTVVRLLETVFDERFKLNQSAIETDLFIQPGHIFRAVDALITNFHQPGSSHLLLVEAFLGRKLLERSYSEALSREYRFLSYGDGMFIE